MAVVFRTSGIFAETFQKSVQREPDVAKRLLDFRKAKSQDPLSAFGASDTSFSSEVSLGKLVPKLRHAHLTRDTSVFYTISGRDPTEIKLYGVFNHADSGTSRPPNRKKQVKLAQVLQRQTFS